MPSQSQRSIERLALLCSRRWAVGTLAVLGREEGTKFVTLCRRLDASPGAMRQSLDHLIDLDLVRRNPGYGHPLRPEYILTARGDRLAPASVLLDDALLSVRLRDLGFRRWTLPALAAISDDPPARFGEIASTLLDITDRALSLALKPMVASDLVKPTQAPQRGYSIGTLGLHLLPGLDQIRRSATS